MYSKPVFLQGVFPFVGKGLTSPEPLSPELTYTIAMGRRGQLIYFRAGNSSSELVYLALMRDDKLMRMFPVSAKGAIHVPLAVVEDLASSTTITVQFAAPDQSAGHLVIDIGISEV